MSTLLIKILRIFIPPLISSGILVVPAPRSAPLPISAIAAAGVAQRRQFQIGQRQVLDLGGGIAGDEINNLLAKGMDHPRQQNGKQRHNGQRLARGRPLARRRSRLPRLKATTTVVPRSMAAKEGHDDHVKAIGQPHPGHGLFSPAS